MCESITNSLKFVKLIGLVHSAIVTVVTYNFLVYLLIYAPTCNQDVQPKFSKTMKLVD